MLLPCPSCKAELSAALVGADGRCPYCGTKAVTAAGLEPPKPKSSPPRERPSREPSVFAAVSGAADTVPSPRARARPEPDIGGAILEEIPPAPTSGSPASGADTDTAPSPRAARPPETAPAAPVAESAATDSPKTAPLPRGWGGLAVGSRGILHGKPSVVLSRVRFQVERPRTIGWWDAWEIRFSEGSAGWLFDREGALAILRPYEPESAIAVESLREGMLVRLDAGPPATVVDLGAAVVRGVEGPSDWSAGQRVRYATLAGDAWRYHLHWTESGRRACWRGERLEPSMLAAGFGLKAPSGFRESAASSVEWIGQLPLSMQILLILLAIPVLAGLALWAVFDRLADTVGAGFR